jgi:hypothetical protein
MNAIKVICPVFLVTILTSSNVAASAFTITDVHSEVLGSLGYLGDSFFYDIRSSNPISYGGTVPTPNDVRPFEMVQTTAAGPYLSVAAEGRVANAAAFSTIDFTAGFDGTAPDISFFGRQPTEGWGAVPGFGSLPPAGWTITDVTTNTLIVPFTTVGLGFTSRPLTYADGPDYSWNSTDAYQLYMWLTVGTNAGGLYDGWLSTDLFTVSTPEPSTILLSYAGLVLLACFGGWLAVRPEQKCCVAWHLKPRVNTLG